MPNRAKLTTRGISTTTVTTETLPKNASLTNNELDSNFINLRDQTFSIVGDDSSGIDVRAGDTIKFLGAGGATITATGSTITVTAGGGGGTGDLTIVGSTISGPSNADINLTAGGTGDINLNADTVRLGDENASVVLTSNGATSGDFTIKIGSDSTPYIKLTDAGTIEIAPDINSATFLKSDITTLGSGGSSGTLNTNGAVDLILRTNTSGTSSTIELKPGANGDINIWPNGTGKIQLDNNYWPNTDGTNGQTLITDGAGNLSWTTPGSSATLGDFTFNEITMSTNSTNGDMKIVSNGTGDIELNSTDIRLSASHWVYVGSQVLSVGNTDVDATITSDGTGDLILMTNNIAGTPNSGIIKINAGAGQPIEIEPNGAGDVYLTTDTVRVGDSNSNVTITTNGTGDLILNTNSGTSSGTIRIYDGANENITIIPNGSGKIQLDANYWPNTDGTAGQALITDGSGVLSWTTATAQGITFVGDDSTGTRISDNETIKIAGAGGITTAMSGDTLTISGSQGITIVGDDSTGTRVSDNETFKIAGAGSVSTAVSGDTLTITGTNTTYSISAETATGGANLRLTDSGATTDDVKIASGTGITVSRTDANTITVATSATYLTDIVNDTTPQLGGSLDVNGQTITSTSNGNIELAPNGTGDVYLTADTVRVGDSGVNATITTNGAGDLILNTNSGTNSGNITIADGTNGTITVATNGTGYLDLHKSFDSTNFPQTPASGNTNWAGATSTSYVGTRMLYSNQAQGDITQADDRVRANTRLISIKHPNDSTTYNDTDYIIQNTDLIVLDINGQSFGSTLTGSRGASVRGEANNVIMKNTAGGTKTGPNLIGGSGFVEVENGHGGDLTAVNVMGFRSFISNRANTGEFTRITNAYGYLSEGIGAGGSGTSGTNRFVTNEFGFWSQGSTSTNLVTNYYGFYANTGATATNKYAFYSADDAYLSRLGTIERVREKQNALTSSSTITVDADLAPVHKVTLAENTQFGITGLSTGQTVTIIIVQDGTGNRTATFTSDTSTAVKFAGGTPALSTAANAIDVVKIYNDGTNFLGVIEKAFA